MDFIRQDYQTECIAQTVKIRLYCPGILLKINFVRLFRTPSDPSEEGQLLHTAQALVFHVIICCSKNDES